MPFKFNPFSGNFDQTGSGGGASYIDGEEATYNDLSLDAGVAPLNSAWLVRNSSGIWPFNKPGGIYIRTATGGSSRDSDYTYAGTMPDVFSDAVLTIYDEASTTRTGQFNLGSVTAGQNRVLTWPNANGTIARTEDFAAPPAIGNTTPNTGAFTTLSVSGRLAATSIGPSGANAYVGIAINPATSERFAVYNGRTLVRSNDAIGWSSADSLGASPTTGASLFRDGENNAIAQRNGAVAQTFRLYGQITGTDVSATGNYERGYMRWSAAGGTFQIGTEKGSGGGLARALEFQTDGTTRLTITATGGMVMPAFVQIGGATSAHVALKRNSNTLQIRTADDLGFGALLCGTLTLFGNLDASTRNIVTDTTTGTKIGTATTQKIGFFNATPVVQQAAIADATDAATTQARLNDLLATMRTFGFIAT